MSEVAAYEPGSFCWIEIATSDTAAARHFYSLLFAWDAHDTDAGPEGPYTILKRGGKEVCGLLHLGGLGQSRGATPHWLLYISVESADAAAEKARALGGTVVTGPLDVRELGRTALVRDPAGALFALWQAKGRLGAEVMHEPGALCWSELAARNTKAACRFYGKLFGWEAKESGIPGMEYTEFCHGQKPIAGMYPAPGSEEDVPSHWMSYIMVEDCDTTANKAISLGGRLTAPPTDIPSVGRFAVIQDPQGARFAIIHMNEPA